MMLNISQEAAPVRIKGRTMAAHSDTASNQLYPWPW